MSYKTRIKMLIVVNPHFPDNIPQIKHSANGGSAGRRNDCDGRTGSAASPF